MRTKNNKQNLSRRKIINSAMILFANKGFGSTSTREICAHAGVNLSLISYYFKTKEGLYTNIIESIVNYGLSHMQEEIRMSQEVYAMIKDEKVRLLYTMLEKYTNFLYSDSVPNSFVILMIKEQTVSNSKFAVIYTERIQIFYKALRRVMASILNKNENDKMIIFEISSIIGEIITFKLMSRATLNALEQSCFTPDDNKKIKKLITSNVSVKLEKLGIKKAEEKPKVLSCVR